MENLKQEDLIETVPTSETETVVEQDPLKTELEKVKGTGRTELEKAEFSLKKNSERLIELGGDPNAILGIKKEPVESDDNTPVTRAELKKIIEAGATKTATQLADEIPDPTERELVKHYLLNRIQPSGNPQEDLRDARRMVNSIRNEQIATEAARKNQPKSHSNASGAPPKSTQAEEELTQTEVQMMVFGHLTKEEVLKARTG